MSKKTKTPPPEPPTRYELETFRRVGPYLLMTLDQPEPDCFNGMVMFRKWKVTMEMVDEPADVLYARLLKIWRKSRNHHDVQPLQQEARKLGMELPYDQRGADYKKP